MLLDARDDGLTYARLGVLSAVVAGIENRTGTLVGSRYEDGALVGATSPFRFDGQDGSSAVGDALHYLALNGLLAVERGGPEVRIRLGPRMQEFLSSLGGGETNGST